VNPVLIPTRLPLLHAYLPCDVDDDATHIALRIGNADRAECGRIAAWPETDAGIAVQSLTTMPRGSATGAPSMT